MKRNGRTCLPGLQSSCSKVHRFLQENQVAKKIRVKKRVDLRGRMKRLREVSRVETAGPGNNGFANLDSVLSQGVLDHLVTPVSRARSRESVWLLTA